MARRKNAKMMRCSHGRQVVMEQREEDNWKREDQKPCKRKAKKSKTFVYKQDTYEGIEYQQRLTAPSREVRLIDATEFTLKVLPSQF